MKFLVFLLLVISLNVQGKLIQILHTNDLHGFIETSVRNPEVGGYAKISQLFSDLKKEATAKGMDTLILDGGDFLEGSVFYQVKNGRSLWNIMDHMGFDAVAVGNHDYLMGTRELDNILKEIPPTFDYIGANFKTTNPLLYPNIAKHIKPYSIFEKAGVKIGIVGLTTNEIFYTWRFTNGKIKAPNKVAHKVAKKLKEEGVDFVFALTHIGLNGDKKLVSKSEDYDLIVGGHSHTALLEPVLQKNKKGLNIPIVQSGSHGRFIGRVIIDLEKGKPLRVIENSLIPIRKDLKENPIVQQFVQRARKDLNREYRAQWLDETLGYSEIPLRHSGWFMTPWTALITQSLKDSVKADVSFHSPNFGGADLPEGEVKREEVMQSHPRVFDFENRKGWFVYKVEAYGVLLKSIIRVALKTKLPLAFSGVTFDLVDDATGEIFTEEDWSYDNELYWNEFVKDEEESLYNRYFSIDDKYRVVNIKINGKPIKSFKRYSVALNEGIVVGGLGITSLVKLLLRKISKTEITVWDAIANQVKKVGTITPNYSLKGIKKIDLGPKNVPMYKGQNLMFKSGLSF